MQRTTIARIMIIVGLSAFIGEAIREYYIISSRPAASDDSTPPSRLLTRWGTIYMRTDGTIEPSESPIETQDNKTYSLTEDIGCTNTTGIIIERDNVTVDGNNHLLQDVTFGYHWTTGIQVNGRSNVAVLNFEVNGFSQGVDLRNSSFNRITRNRIVGNQYGISLDLSSSNILEGNEISRSVFQGLRLSRSRYNRINGNLIADNLEGLVLDWYSSHNSVFENNITNNGRGLVISVSSENVIYRNLFLKNVHQGYDNSAWRTLNLPMSTNSWDNGFEGNFWSDYIGTDSDDDGIGDTAYIIDGFNQDNCPLMSPYMLGNMNHDAIVASLMSQRLLLHMAPSLWILTGILTVM